MRDLTGQRFGKLLVLGFSHRAGSLGYWLTRCDCGVEKPVYRGHLLSGRQQSCGCGRRNDAGHAEPESVSGARWVPLGHGRFTLVDEADYGWVSSKSWCLDSAGYACRRGERLHRLLLPGDHIADHINGDKLDNRRANLRPATAAQSAWNTGKRRDAVTSSRKGVDRVKTGKWRARIRHLGRVVHLGLFATEEEASRAYEEAAAAWREGFGRKDGAGTPGSHVGG